MHSENGGGIGHAIARLSMDRGNALENWTSECAVVLAGRSVRKSLHINTLRDRRNWKRPTNSAEEAEK